MASDAVTARDAAQGVQTRPMLRRFSAASAIRVAVVAVLLAILAAGTHGVRAAVPSEGPPSTEATQASPNVVVILTDDEPALDGRLMNTMPNAHELFREHGITFTDFHVETSLCCPARAGYLTGQHTHNHGVTKNLARLFNPVMSLATALHDAGYYTGLVGKYLNEYSRLAPTVPPGWDRWVAFGDAKYYDYDLWIDGNPIPETHGDAAEDYATDVISAKAVALIRSAPRDRPLFLWVAPNAPHAPTWQVAPRYRNAPCAVPRWKPPNYDEFNVIDKPLYIRRRRPIGGKGKELKTTCRQLLAVDDLVGAVRDELAARGRLENTIFVYAGDNGYFQGEHRIGSGKGAPYVTDVPFALAWPAGLGSEPRTITERLQNIDFAPTICALAGCTLGPYPNGQTRPDGLSFAPLLLGSATTVGRDAVIEEMLNAVPPVSTPYAALVTTDLSPLGRWHYVEYANGERELYDVSNGPCWAWRSGVLPGDPCELINKVNYPTNAATVRALHLRLRELEQEKGRPQQGS